MIKINDFGNRPGIPIWIWLKNNDEIEDKLLEEAKNVATLPFAKKHFALMPDCHPSGHGMPIGGVLATEDVVIPNAVSNDIGCFTGDTKISLLSGENKKIKDLAKDNKDFWVYSRDEKNNIVPAKAIAFKTKDNAELIKITLDNNKEIKCTPDHKFMLKNGNYKKAEDLKSDDSLMPLYKKRYNYENILSSSFNKVKFKERNYRKPTHMIVAEKVYGEIPDGYVIHHKNKNKFDNRPENLRIMKQEEHNKLHSNEKHQIEFLKSEQFKNQRLKKLNENGFYDEKYYEKKKEVATNNITKYMNNNVEDFKRVVEENAERGSEFFSNNNNNSEMIIRQKLGKIRKIIMNCKSENIKINKNNYERIRRKKYKTFPKYQKAKNFIKDIGFNNFKEIVDKKYWNEILESTKFNYHNHKIKSIEKLNYKEEVYDLNVPKYHNFALESGVFVHNCGVAFTLTDIDADVLDIETNGQGTVNQSLVGQIMRDLPTGFEHKDPKDNINDIDIRTFIEDKYMHDDGTIGGIYKADEPRELGSKVIDEAYEVIGSLGGGKFFASLYRNI